MMLEGNSLKQVQTVISEFYKKGDFELPGVEIDDWLQVFAA
jgi:hypothetical protein